MLQSMHDKIQGWVAGVIAFIIALTFALWGVQNYLRSGAHQAAAKVNGEEITQRQLDVAYDKAKRIEMLQHGPDFAFDQKVQAQLKRDVLQQLIKKQVLLQAVTKMGLGVGKRQLWGEVGGMPAFQVDGRFSASRFQQIVGNLFHSEQAFFDDLGNTFLQIQLEKGISSSAFVLPNEAELLRKMVTQRRDFGYFIVSPEKFANTVAISADVVKKYYEEHQNDFLLPEKISIQYVELSSDSLRSGIKPNEEQLKAFYQSHIDSFQSAKIKPYSSVATKVKQAYERQQLTQAFSEASDRLTDLVYTNPDSLEPAAKELGLKIQATELVTRDGSKNGILLNNKIINAAFSDPVLKQRYNSNLIEVNAGKVVVLRIKDHIPEKVQPLDQVRAVIMQKIWQQLSQKRAADLANELLGAIRSGKTQTQLAIQYGLAWHTTLGAKYGQAGTAAAKLIAAAFGLAKPKSHDISAAVVELNSSYAVLRLDKVYEDKSSKEISKMDNIIKFLPEAFGQYDYQSLMNNLMRQAKIEITDKVEDR